MIVRSILQHAHALSRVKLVAGQAQSSPVSLNPTTSNEDLREGYSGTAAWYPSIHAAGLMSGV